MMEAARIYSEQEVSGLEIHRFLEDGLEDLRNGNLLDFQSVFDELEKSYDAGG
ncbi:MAG: hypothetical protein HDR00_13900 [Lachnospiraceae bacterium]|nr:hypothetical protein [Lachnospiraceae bacterium]